MIWALTVMMAGCLDGPAAARDRPDVVDDDMFGPLVLYRPFGGEPPDQPTFADDIDPMGRWITVSTRATNMGPYTKADDCDWIRPGSGCRIDYLASLDGAVVEPIAWDNRSEPSVNFGYTALDQDGRVVAFISAAPGFVAGDQDASMDAFAWNRTTDRIVWLSEPQLSSGQPRHDRCAAFCGHISITPDGRLVVFASEAADLVAGDHNEAHDVFVRDASGDSPPVLVSATPSGVPGNGESWTRGTQSISADGRYAVFMSRATDLVAGHIVPPEPTQSYLRDLSTGKTRLISPNGEPWGEATLPRIDATGRWVALAGPAPPGIQGSRETGAVYLFDIESGTSRVISAPAGVNIEGTNSWAPYISHDAAHVAFISDARLAAHDTDDLLDVYLWTRASNTITMASDPRLPGAPDGLATSPMLAEDGTTIVFRWIEGADEEPIDQMHRIVYREIRDRT